MQRYLKPSLIVGGVAVLLTAIGIAWSPLLQMQTQTAKAAAVDPAGIKHADSLSSAFRGVAKKMRPAVVSIRSTRTIRTASNVRPEMPQLPEEFRRFFKDDPFDKFFERMPSRPYRSRGQGSGVIVGEDGYIITNNHVVRNAETVEVVLHDKRTFKAKVVGTDPKTDLAVLKIDVGRKLTHAAFGNSDAMQVGDWVIAVGSPFGLNQTVTAGIVSAKGRDHVGITDYEDFIQTDASINPGNSGGPLVNLRGEVIGINTAIASGTGRNAGVGFAIPSNMVKHVYTAIVKHGRVERGRIGAVIQDLTPKLARSFGYDNTERGVLVGDVVKDGPAAKAGIQSGDIITRYNGRRLRSFSHLRNSIAGTKPGTRVKLRIFRNGKFEDVDVTIAKLEESRPSHSGKTEPVTRHSFDDLGVSIRDVSPEFAKRYRLGEDATGALVTGVKSGSLASQVGIRAGDLIVAIAGKEVANAKAYQEVMKSQELSRGIRMTIISGGLRRFVFVQTR